ncbi:N-acetylglucosamine-1-phosphotransferase subunits alpha/beta-like [Saccoglossus kowalevskii]|uniref:N-acetylglucosamine-1-phosphotransferase subunits alpha/beta-like n=1 Tax=Saccoglossus kowalevskii TaxID=10224 RepID=A0ABM0MMP6_SACKO|nr:PREDICTED: N-acetylglucosamine-1-phosphotransferase subunits alpha/beta-like [Saccoglossus kowalevskii]
MTAEGVYKLLQRQTYTCLSHRYGTFLCFGGVVLVLISALQFGEVAMEWSKVQYEVIFSIYSDNLVSRSFQDRMCLPVPIDVVYTWVNGSDPKLLLDLKRFKSEYEKQGNKTKEHSEDGLYIDGNQTKQIKCKFKDCVPSNFLVLKTVLPQHVTLKQLQKENADLRMAVRMFNVTMSTEDNNNYTVIQLPWKQTEIDVFNQPITLEGMNLTVSKGFLTTDWTAQHSVYLDNTIIMTGLPKDMEDDEIWKVLPENFRQNVEFVDLYEKRGLAVISLTDKQAVHSFLSQSELYYGEDSEIKVTTGNLVWLMHPSDHDTQDMSANRFEDNEELRYSIRSIERYAPWVRHVFIVTNGQIPSWLNLDNPKLTIVTHEEIFSNKSHLPTFGSPAIESHLHQIPGLSQKFIYLNDDVMFGKEVWPDDFYTHSNGQKVYLTWPVPNCNDGCPSSWIKDGYCDKSCNISECEWDGGDCDGVEPGGQYGDLGWGFDTGGGPSKMYCASGCANGWVADRYCDQSCNVADCGFDSGDCGVSGVRQLFSVDIDRHTSHTTLPKGLQVVYFNVTPVFGGGSITDAKYDNNAVVRAATVTNKFKFISLLLYPDFNSTELTFYVHGIDSNKEDTKITFNVTVNTNPPSGSFVTAEEKKKFKLQLAKSRTSSNEVDSTTRKTSREDENVIIFEEIPPEKRAPKIGMKSEELGVEIGDLEETLKSLPGEVSLVLEELYEQVEEGDLTEKGYQRKRRKIVANYLKTGELPWKPEVRGEEDAKNGEVEKEEGFAGKEISLEEQKMKLLDGLGKGDELEKQVKDVDEGVRDQVIGEKIPEANEDHQKLQGLSHEQQEENIEDHHDNDDDNQNAQNVGPNLRRLDMNVDYDDENAFKGNARHLNGFNDAVEMRRGVEDENKEALQVNSWKSRTLANVDAEEMEKIMNSNDNFFKMTSFLPWEKKDVFKDVVKIKKKQQVDASSYDVEPRQSRRLLDTFGDSLRHVNKLYNKKFGFDARKVPAHMPHMIDKYIMKECELSFPEEFDATSSHKIRHSNDMQFAFSYMYFMMGQTIEMSPSEIFDVYDTDRSG